VGFSEKVVEALKSGILMNERLTVFIAKVERMDNDLRHINERLVRLETMVELAQAKPSQSFPAIEPK
jgi:hypothetical protein